MQSTKLIINNSAQSLGTGANDIDVEAAHLFPYIHGQDVMDAIFGKKRPPQLFSAMKGLLLHPLKVFSTRESWSLC